MDPPVPLNTDVADDVSQRLEGHSSGRPLQDEISALENSPERDSSSVTDVEGRTGAVSGNDPIQRSAVQTPIITRREGELPDIHSRLNTTY